MKRTKEETKTFRKAQTSLREAKSSLRHAEHALARASYAMKGIGANEQALQLLTMSDQVRGYRLEMANFTIALNAFSAIADVFSPL